MNIFVIQNIEKYSIKNSMSRKIKILIDTKIFSKVIKTPVNLQIFIDTMVTIFNKQYLRL